LGMCEIIRNGVSQAGGGSSGRPDLGACGGFGCGRGVGATGWWSRLEVGGGRGWVYTCRQTLLSRRAQHSRARPGARTCEAAGARRRRRPVAVGYLPRAFYFVVRLWRGTRGSEEDQGSGGAVGRHPATPAVSRFRLFTRLGRAGGVRDKREARVTGVGRESRLRGDRSPLRSSPAAHRAWGRSAGLQTDCTGGRDARSSGGCWRCFRRVLFPGSADQPSRRRLHDRIAGRLQRCVSFQGADEGGGGAMGGWGGESKWTKSRFDPWWEAGCFDTGLRLQPPREWWLHRPLAASA